MNNWILVAGRANAKVFNRVARNEPVKLIKEFSCPQGKLHEGDLVTGSEGAVFQSAGKGQQRSTETEVSATEHEAEKFAKSLSQMLLDARLQGEFDHLELVADPTFLGHLRGVIDNQTMKVVVREVDKNVAGKPVRELQKYLEDLA